MAANTSHDTWKLRNACWLKSNGYFVTLLELNSDPNTKARSVKILPEKRLKLKLKSTYWIVGIFHKSIHC